ncbi:MAG: DUF3343 domain-containing protein [Oscillospiraceae bacterium]|nr:DUF3343 domain-containing protein [Oscillospiraceae bacterium]MBQ9110959.1 DUF3343 domain-containing protein [Oscillospiraceae bacterium]
MICRAVMPSDTLARKAHRLLRARGFSAEIVRSSGTKEGCGFALRIMGDCNAARDLLERAGIPVRSMRNERDGS